MNKKAYSKSIKVPGDQLLDLERMLRVEEALERIGAKTMHMRTSDGPGGIATLLFKELRKLGDELGRCAFVPCNLDDPDKEQWLSLRGEGLLRRFKGGSRQEKFHQAMNCALKAKKKFFSN